MKLAKFLAFIVFFSLILVCNASPPHSCPPKEELNNCVCGYNHVTPFTSKSLYCGGNATVPQLEKLDFLTITLENTSSHLIILNEVSTVNLEIIGQANYLSHIIPIMGLNFTELKISNVSYALLKQIFDSDGCPNTRSILFEKINLINFDLDLYKFKALKTIRFIGNVESIGANAFQRLNQIHEIDFSNTRLERLEENSLLFPNNKRLNLKLNNNKITNKQLRKSKLSNNFGHINIDLAGNNIDKLPADIYEMFCLSQSRLVVDLNFNQIECNYEEIKWIFNYPDAKHHLKNVFCVNYDHQNIFQIDKWFNTSNINQVIIGSSIGAFILFTIIFGLIYCKHKRKQCERRDMIGFIPNQAHVYPLPRSAPNGTRTHLNVEDTRVKLVDNIELESNGDHQSPTYIELDSISLTQDENHSEHKDIEV